ncbi:preprotein translocase subunit SecE [Calycomorphotria hydatis]|uniref:Protein translocase subunit SecE n=2 Tax=Calycomorphotria hydatis TaxID=2528027 RepID=A0A517T8C7_9PLAN|nr:preprotein translocase subunit SecE [Calycomorphotria hydatis]
MGLYKRNQGRLTRQMTVLSLWVIIFMGCYVLSQGPLADYDNILIRVGIPTLLAAIGAWVAFRLVHIPKFADFLVAVQGEMDKVSWPGRQELVRSTIVVVTIMFLLAAALFSFDYIWQFVFRALGIVKF